MVCNFVTLLTAYNSFCSVLMGERIFALTRVLERDLPKVSDNMSVAMIYARFVLPNTILRCRDCYMTGVTLSKSTDEKESIFVLYALITAFFVFHFPST